MSNLSIQMLLIRDVSSTTNDDEITIKKNLATNEFSITYVDPNDGSPIKHTLTSLYRSKVLDYVYMLLKNLYLDEEGFESVQINLPALPRVIVSGDKFKDVYYREHFYELVGFGLDSLETVSKTPTRPTTSNCPNLMIQRAQAALDYAAQMNADAARFIRPQHLFFDE